MKSGLYAWAGASAIASAAAWAKRFDEPITNESNVYFGLIADAARRGGRPGGWGGAGAGGRDDELEPPLAARGVGDAGPDQVGEPALDPLAGEVVRHGEDERLVVEVRPAATSPNQLRKVFSLRVPRRRADTSFQRDAAVSSFGCSTRAARSFGRFWAAARIAPVQRGGSMRNFGSLADLEKVAVLQGETQSPHHSPQVWKAQWAPARFGRTFHDFSACRRPVDNRRSGRARLYWPFG